MDEITADWEKLPSYISLYDKLTYNDDDNNYTFILNNYKFEYDSVQQCCEWADWHITEDPLKYEPKYSEKDNLIQDLNLINNSTIISFKIGDFSIYDNISMCVIDFLCTSGHKYLVFFNRQARYYYCHEFNFYINDKNIYKTFL